MRCRTLGGAAARVALVLIGVVHGVTPGLEGGYADASVLLDRELLGHEFVDVEGDGVLELALVVRGDDGGRELRLHRQEGDRYSAEPFRSVRVLPDALAYAFADVRAEPGRELVFLARTGAFAFSLGKPGYRDNLARLLSADLLYDVPDADGLPRWPYVLRGGGRDRIVLPTAEGVGVFGARGREVQLPANAASGAEPGASEGAEATPYRLQSLLLPERQALLTLPTDVGTRESTELTFDASGASLRLRASFALGPFLGDAAPGNLVDDSRSLPAPAMVDVDGDGREDLVIRREDSLAVYLVDDVLSAQPTRMEALPEACLGTEDQEVELWFQDVDADGDADLLSLVADEQRGLTNGDWLLFTFINDGARLIPEKPAPPLRFRGAVVVVGVADVDGDDLPDLTVRRFEVPSGLEVVSGLEFTLTHLFFPGSGDPRRPFARKPLLDVTQRYGEDSVERAIATRYLTHDADGDGVADLIEIDLRGRIAIRRVVRDRGFFGTTWTIEDERDPWRRFDLPSTFGALEVDDFNGDGRADVATPRERGLTLLLSVEP